MSRWFIPPRYCRNGHIKSYGERGCSTCARNKEEYEEMKARKHKEYLEREEARQDRAAAKARRQEKQRQEDLVFEAKRKKIEERRASRHKVDETKKRTREVLESAKKFTIAPLPGRVKVVPAGFVIRRKG